MAAAFALTVIVNQQAALRLMRLPDNRGDRSQARQTTPGKFTRRVIALVRHRLADVVVIPARGAVGADFVATRIVVPAWHHIAAAGAVERIAPMVRLEGHLARKATHAAGGIVGDFLQQSLIFILSLKWYFLAVIGRGGSRLETILQLAVDHAG
jgi:hypothetical protein